MNDRCYCAASMGQAHARGCPMYEGRPTSDEDRWSLIAMLPLLVMIGLMLWGVLVYSILWVLR